LCSGAKSDNTHKPGLVRTAARGTRAGLLTASYTRIVPGTSFSSSSFSSSFCGSPNCHGNPFCTARLLDCQKLLGTQYWPIQITKLLVEGIYGGEFYYTSVYLLLFRVFMTFFIY
jgi:hypothetical protein